MTITEFIPARVDQDEGDAVAYWQDDGDEPGTWLGWVKADCEAKRRIVELHRPEAFADDPALTFCAHCQRTAGEYPCQTVRILATIWADHLDYREEWRAA